MSAGIVTLVGMKLDQRQKILVGALVGVLLLWQGGGVLWGIVFGPINTRNTQVAALEEQLKKKKDAKHQLDLTERRTRNWELRSLPPNPVVASTLYHHWVLDLAGKHKLSKLSVTPKRISTGSSNPVFTRIPVSLTGECKMDQLCQFLYEFYRTDLLHKVTHLGAESIDNRSNPTLKVSLELEGLSLATAKPRTTLFADKQESAVSDAMAKKSLKDYDALIATNRFVRGYNGPPAPIISPPPPAAPFDATPHIKLVASLEQDGQRQAWLFDQSSNQNTILIEGKDFEIAGVRGQTIEISKRSIKLKVKDKNWQLDLGSSLKQMIELPSNGQPVSAPPGAAPTTNVEPAITTPSATAPVSATKLPDMLPLTPDQPISSGSSGNNKPANNP